MTGPHLEVVNGDVTRAALDALKERAIDNPEQYLKLAAPDRILATCRWYDEQGGRVGPGVLVMELRAGGKPATWSPQAERSLLDEQRVYGDSIAAWLHEKFPALCDPDPHPAAIAAVIRLHFKHGKGRLTVAEHGAEIRAAVADFKRRFEDPPIPAQSTTEQEEQHA